jgi:Lrp/AsnC family transcriptional regulator, leucine-responsive regulatory protein
VQRRDQRLAAGGGVAAEQRRLEEAGGLRGYRAEVDLEAAGFPVQAVLRVNIPGARYDRINQLLPGLPEVYHCLRVAGEDCYVLLVRATSIPTSTP